MNEHEFLNYLETPTERYFKGIATVRLYGRIILKYKIVEKKDGTGFFVAPPNYRIPTGDGSHKYMDAFMIDSRSEHDELLQLVRNGVNQSTNPRATQAPQQQQATQGQQQAGSFQPDLDACPF
ncbi:MAG TPA: hypothetical protein VMX17_02300 [Candidatus Glassbacteria bacterium]|nr:hypothetical protein [Candidatus Glassbacteria bacterium]